MATITKEELAELQAETASTTTSTADETQTYEGKFIGTLVGQATTAKELEKPYKFVLAGDTTGSVDVNASDVILQTTTTHADSADTADFAGKTNLAARATLADLANLATYSLETEKIANLILTFSGMIEGEGIVEHGATVDINIDKINAAGILKIGELPTGENADNADKTKIYIDLANQHVWVYDNASSLWIDVHEQVNETLEKHGTRLSDLEALTTTHTAEIADHETRITTNRADIDSNDDDISALQELTTTHTAEIADHETRITTNRADIDSNDDDISALQELTTTHTAEIADLDDRVGNIETTSDVGEMATELAKIKTSITAIQDNYVTTDSKSSTAQQVITGIKNFRAPFSATSYGLCATSDNISKNTYAGSTEQKLGLNFYGKGTTNTVGSFSSFLGAFRYRHDNSGKRSVLSMAIANPERTTEDNAFLSIGYKSGETKPFSYVFDPNDTSDTSQNIANVKYVNSKVNSALEECAPKGDYVTLDTEQTITAEKTMSVSYTADELLPSPLGECSGVKTILTLKNDSITEELSSELDAVRFGVITHIPITSKIAVSDKTFTNTNYGTVQRLSCLANSFAKIIAYHEVTPKTIRTSESSVTECPAKNLDRIGFGFGNNGIATIFCEQITLPDKTTTKAYTSSYTSVDDIDSSTGSNSQGELIINAYCLRLYAEEKFKNYAPAYTYGTEELTVGESVLETGKLHFVY